MKIFDFLVIGGGISGTSAAYELANFGSVALLESESSLGYHSTGRSAALFTRNFGNKTVRAINQVSETFFNNPPDGFCLNDLLTPRGSLTIATPGQEKKLDLLFNYATEQNKIEQLTPEETSEMAKIVKSEQVGIGAYEPGVTDIDVASLHQGYIKGFLKRGGEIFKTQPVEQMNYEDEIWQIKTGKSEFQAKQIINAAGGWAEQIGILAKAAKIGLVAKRRTAVVVEAPNGIDVNKLPVIEFTDSNAYIKAEGGKLMVCPGDQTPVEPQDIQPDEMDVAILIDWLQNKTNIKVKRIEHSWAGLRSFVADEIPVVGYDAKAPKFFWLAGQGGFGIMMAPTLACACASLIVHKKLPQELLDVGVTADSLSPNRFSN